MESIESAIASLETATLEVAQSSLGRATLMIAHLRDRLTAQGEETIEGYLYLRKLALIRIDEILGKLADPT